MAQILVVQYTTHSPSFFFLMYQTQGMLFLSISPFLLSVQHHFKVGLTYSISQPGSKSEFTQNLFCSPWAVRSRQDLIFCRSYFCTASALDRGGNVLRNWRFQGLQGTSQPPINPGFEIWEEAIITIAVVQSLDIQGISSQPQECAGRKKALTHQPKVTTHCRACVETHSLYCLCGFTSSVKLFGCLGPFYLLSSPDKNRIILQLTKVKPTEP